MGSIRSHSILKPGRLAQIVSSAHWETIEGVQCNLDLYLHWQLSLNRYRLLIGAYVFYFLINGLSLLFVDGTHSMDGTNITDFILSLLSAVPLFFSVLISVVLGSGSMFNAGRGEISEKMIQKYPQ